MSFIIEYDHGALKQCRKTRERTTPSPLYYHPEKQFFCCGELFGLEYSQLMDMPWKETPSILNDLDGAVAVAQASEEKLYFASDMNGVETFYYYHHNKRFILSDDFWQLSAAVQPGLNDFNKDYIEQSLFWWGHLEGQTILNNVWNLRTNRLCRYDAVTDTFTCEHFSEYHYTEKCNDIDEAVENTDRILDAVMEKLKRKFGDVTYGLGISGGLDSRIVAHYACKHGLKLKGFNICVPKPHGLFYGRGVKNGKQIADTYGIDYSIVEWKPRTLQEKLLDCIKAVPTYNGNSFKYEKEGMPDFDILLTGGSGYVVDNDLPAAWRDITRDELIDMLCNMFCGELPTTFMNRAKRAISFLLKIEFKKEKQYEDWFAVKLMGNEYILKLRKYLSDYVDQKLQEGLSNGDIITDLYLNVFGYLNRYGAFESQFGTKRAFSIYTPFLMKETMSWNLDLLYERKVITELIRRKIPELADIKSETFTEAPGESKSLWHKAIGLADFLLKGNSTAIDQYYLRNAEIRRQFLKEMNGNLNDWFHKLMNIENVKLDNRIFRVESERMIIRIWELKLLVDCMENNHYLIQ